MASKNGSAIVAPIPCRMVRRGNDLGKGISVFSSSQFDAVWEARMRNVGLSTIPMMIDDQQ